ncbi:subtilisin-like protease [Metarhizium anisopliae]
MKFMHWSLVASALLQSAAAAPQDTGKNADATQELGHIVVLKQGLKDEHLDKHLDWVNEIHKGSLNSRDGANGQDKGVKHTYRSESIGFHGYSGRFSDEVLKQIKDHEHVDFVEEDKRNTLEIDTREEVQGDKLPEPDKVDTPPESVGNQNKNNAVGRLTRGQGYNTFLEKGRIADAVIWPENKKRAEPDAPAAGAGNDAAQNEIVFDFTPPTTDLGDFEGVDAAEYFKTPKPDEVKNRITEKLKKLKEERKKQREEKKKLLESNNLQSRADDPNCPGTLRKEYKFVEDYNTYLETVGISGSAAISGWGQSASVHGNYLNQAKINKNSLTYVAILNVERQLSQPGGFQFNTARYKPGRFAKDFGDRWIHGFKTGGKMVARVTFTFKDDTKAKDVKAHAEAALSFWGVKGDLSVDVKKGMEEVNKHTNVDVSLIYEGELAIFMGDKEGSPKSISFGSAEAVLSQVKSWADKFESYACKHDYAYGPLLDEYDVVPGFSDLEDSPEAPDYDIARLYAVEILALLVKIDEQKNILDSAKELDDKKKREVKTAAIKMVSEGKKWVKTAEEDPGKAEEQAAALMKNLSDNFIDKYRGDVASALKVNDPAGFAKCKKLANDKARECTSTHKEKQDGVDVIEFCAKEANDVLNQCRAGTL